MRVALVHDYLSQDGGAERVLKAMHEMWPEAPIFVLFHDREKINYIPIENIRESFIAKLPWHRQAYRWYLPLMPIATEKYRLKNFDLIISSTSAFAKGIIPAPHALHISYCHTPPRYLWADAEEYLDDASGLLIRVLLPRLIHKLRIWDKISVDRVDHFLANSETVKQRISKYYRRASSVIYPPIDAKQFNISAKIDDYFLTGGRLVPYKKLHIAVQAFNRLGWPLKIFGVGPEMAKLKRMAKSNIQFLGKISETEKITLFNHARAFIHPQLEDSGLTAVEAMASGRPVIAYAQGGATEKIRAGETGLFFSEQNWESLLQTLLDFSRHSWDSEVIRAHATRYDMDNFKQELKNFVEQKYQEHLQNNTI
ncbi:MAG: glycosyltransferase [bacterium]|nr:glycosyltransferase [bacterium]